MGRVRLPCQIVARSMLRLDLGELIGCEVPQTRVETFAVAAFSDRPPLVQAVQSVGTNAIRVVV
jgi:hypothetical protein